MIIEADTDKSLPPPPPVSKEEEAAKDRKAERERVALRRGQSSRSYMEAPPPSYETVERGTPESQLPSTSDSSFTFVRPSPSHSPPFPDPQFPRLVTPSHEPPLPPAPRTLAQSSSHSNLRPHTTAHRSSISLDRSSLAYASTPTLVPRSVDFFPTTSPIPLVYTPSYGYSSTTLSTAPYPSTLSVNTVSPDIPPTTSSSNSNSPPIQVPTFTPSVKKSFFSTQAGNKKRNAKEARSFVLSQITTILQNQTIPQYNVDTHKSILGSCSGACSAHELYLPAILQEKFVEDHTPFYWSIVQRPSSSSSRMPDLLQALLLFGSPLTEDTRMEVGRACLMVNDPKLYQALRVNKYFMGSGTAEGVLSPQSIYNDRVIIEDKGGGTGGGNGEFAATLEIPRYKERPVIHVEFIAQRRLWRLSIRKPSTTRKWKIAISLLEQSPATYLDSRFTLQSLNELPVPSRSNSFPSTLPPPQPASPTRTPSLDDTVSVSTGSGSSSSGSTVLLPSYGYGVPSAFVAAAYSGYPPEKMEMAQQQRPVHMASSRTNSDSNTNALSFYPDVVKGTSSAIRDRQESYSSVSSDNCRRALASTSSCSVDDENGVIGNGGRTRSGSEGQDNEGDEFLISTHDPLPPLPTDSVLKEVRLKSNSMISPGKKEIESEVEIDIGLTEEGVENTMRARFEARLAKPESECVIC